LIQWSQAELEELVISKGSNVNYGAGMPWWSWGHWPTLAIADEF